MSEAIIVEEGSLVDLKRASKSLQSAGIRTALLPKDGPDCKVGCGTKFLLCIPQEDLDKAREHLGAQWAKTSAGHPDAHENVLDFSQPTMTCPACLTTFDTGPEECPDCGLYIGGPE